MPVRPGNRAVLIGSFTLPPEALVLDHTVLTTPEIAVEAERIAAHSTEWVMPCLWVTADDFDAVEAAMQSDPSVAGVIETTRFEQEAFFHVDWDEAVKRRFDAYLDRAARSSLPDFTTGRGRPICGSPNAISYSSFASTSTLRAIDSSCWA